MPRVVREAVVHAPPDRVYRALVHERAAWMTSFKEEPVAGEPAVGTRIEATRVGSTSGSRYAFVVTAMEPARLLAMDVYRNGKKSAKGTFELARVDGGTRVRDVGEVELSGLQKMLAPVVTGALERQLEAELAALKRHVERG